MDTHGICLPRLVVLSEVQIFILVVFLLGVYVVDVLFGYGRDFIEFVKLLDALLAHQ